MNNTQTAAEYNAVPHDPAMAAPVPGDVLADDHGRKHDPQRPPDLGVAQAGRRLPASVRAVAGNRRADR